MLKCPGIQLSVFQMWINTTSRGLLDTLTCKPQERKSLGWFVLVKKQGCSWWKVELMLISGWLRASCLNKDYLYSFASNSGSHDGECFSM